MPGLYFGYLGVKCDGLLQLDERQIITVEMLTPPGSRMGHNVLYNPDLGVVPRALVPAEQHPLLQQEVNTTVSGGRRITPLGPGS